MRTWAAVRRGRAGGSKAGAADMGAAQEDGCAAFRHKAVGRVRNPVRSCYGHFLSEDDDHNA